MTRLNKGFTIIELMIVIGMLGIMGGIAFQLDPWILGVTAIVELALYIWLIKTGRDS